MIPVERLAGAAVSHGIALLSADHHAIYGGSSMADGAHVDEVELAYANAVDGVVWMRDAWRVRMYQPGELGRSGNSIDEDTAICIKTYDSTIDFYASSLQFLTDRIKRLTEMREDRNVARLLRLVVHGDHRPRDNRISFLDEARAEIGKGIHLFSALVNHHAPFSRMSEKRVEDYLRAWVGDDGKHGERQIWNVMGYDQKRQESLALDLLQELSKIREIQRQEALIQGFSEPQKSLGVVALPSNGDGFSADKRTFKWKGVSYSLSLAASKVVEVLFEGYQNGERYLIEEHIKTEAEVYSDIRTLVRDNELEGLIVRELNAKGKRVNGKWGLS